MNTMSWETGPKIMGLYLKQMPPQHRGPILGRLLGRYRMRQADSKI